MLFANVKTNGGSARANRRRKSINARRPEVLRGMKCERNVGYCLLSIRTYDIRVDSFGLM